VKPRKQGKIKPPKTEFNLYLVCTECGPNCSYTPDMNCNRKTEAYRQLNYCGMREDLELHINFFCKWKDPEKVEQDKLTEGIKAAKAAKGILNRYMLDCSMVDRNEGGERVPFSITALENDLRKAGVKFSWKNPLHMYY
jgi:hypothetical protein